MTTKNAKCTLCADDTSIIVTNPSCKDLKIKTIKIFLDIYVNGSKLACYHYTLRNSLPTI